MTTTTLRRRPFMPGAGGILATVAGAAAIVAVTPVASAATSGHAGTAGRPAYGPASVPSEDPTVPGKLLLLLDASGSMNAKDPSGLTKIAAAKKALVAVVNGLPTDSQVGLRVYGATQAGGKPTPAACADTQLVHPITALDKAGLTAAINRFQAKGETPIAGSLRAALKDLGATGKRNIVLVSDGEESCVADPCPVIRSIVGAGVDLQIDTVGFGVNSKARKQLQCIADAGHGTYYDAKDATALGASLGKLSQRAVRAFTVNGTPIKGTPTEDGAPTLLPGRFTDAFPPVKESERNYLLRRTIPGSTIRLSVSSRPPAGNDWLSVESWKIHVEKVRGKSCVEGYSAKVDPLGLRNVVSARALISGPGPGQTANVPDECATATDFKVRVTRTGEGGAVPIEILYIEEPPLRDTAGLAAPGPDRIDTKAASPAQGSGQPVLGGASFSDALRIAPGTYVESLIPGEVAFYRVHIDWGQRAVLAIDGPTKRFTRKSSTALPLWVSGDVWSPDREQVDTQETWRAAAYGANLRTTIPDINVVPTVAYRNRETTNLARFALAGDYYFGVGIANKGAVSSLGLQGQVIPIRFSVAVTGTPTGKPDYAAVTPNPSASRAASTSAPRAGDKASNTWLLWVGGGAAVLAAIAYVAYLSFRRLPRAGAIPGDPTRGDPTLTEPPSNGQGDSQA